MGTKPQHFSPPADTGLELRLRNDRHLMPQRTSCMWTRLVLVLLMIFSALPMLRAEEYITGLKVVGRDSKTEMNAQKETLKNQGWKIVDTDLNQSAGGYYIYLMYKTNTTANPESGYVTDIIAKKTNEPNGFTWNGRKYYKVPTDGFDGDLNKNAAGSYIYLYFTRDRSKLSGHYGTKRVLNKIEASENDNSAESGKENYGPVCWLDAYSNNACDANTGCGSNTDYIYIRMFFKEQKLKVQNKPSAIQNLVFTGNSQRLVAAPSNSNYGTMKYNVDGGSYSTSLPTAINVGEHQVNYFLDGGSYANNSDTTLLKVNIAPPTVKPTGLTGEFFQREKQVLLKWGAPTELAGYTNYVWVVYRGNDKIKTLQSNETREWTDKDYPIDNTAVEYSVYYVSKTWNNEDTKDANCVAKVKVNTTRKIPVNNLQATSDKTKLTLTWTSDGYPAGWGNKFNIYVDDETTPVYTITPSNYQTEFQWEHRYTDAHADRVNGSTVVNGKTVYYTEEQNLGACTPHNYRVEGVIGDKMLNKGTLTQKAIGAATQFYSFEASKGSYAGSVKLSWHVDNQGSTVAKTYIIERRTTENENEAWTVLDRMNSADEYLMYTDETALTGVYYDYKVTAVDKCPNGTIINTDAQDIGFSQSTGTVSGRVTFGASGSAVDSVDVIMTKASVTHALRFNSTNAYVTWKYPDNKYANKMFQTADYSMQMWINPDEFPNAWLGRLKGENIGAFGIDGNGHLLYCCGTTPQHNFTTLTLKKGEYNHVTLTRKGNVVTFYVVEANPDGRPIVHKESKTIQDIKDMSGSTQFNLGYFNGYIDEFRIWSKCLSENEIVGNFDRQLVGNESNLLTYWTFDEGLSSQFFDYSREGTVYNGHHGKIENNVESSTIVPSDLNLKGTTDSDGNYIIAGIPFSGDGTNYTIRPMKNSHEFSPQKQSRFISKSSLVQNSVDFTDVSSFEVSGTVLYEGTTIPVDSVMIYVDGRAVSRNGEAVMTDEKGKFVVDVPIGNHYLTAVRDGHTFVNEGRIPADPSGLNSELIAFTSPRSGLKFTDNTLVPIVGRVVGGAIESEKPLGFGLSENNIGKAVITLEIPDKRYMINAHEEFADEGHLVSNGYFPTKTATALPHPTNMNNPGDAYRTGGTYENDAKQIVITTDAVTGEFGAMVPPLDYKVVSVQMENAEGQKVYVFKPEELPRIDASNAATVLKDSMQTDNGEMIYFDYVAKFVQSKHTEPVLSVTQGNLPEGVYGNSQASYVDPLTQKETNVNVYTLNNNKVTYNFGYPIFGELGTYTFFLEGYENYTNYDKDATDSKRESKVPLRDVVVTISNALSSDQVVQSADDPTHAGEVLDLKPNQLKLDSLGKATYKWKAGLPNIQSPFTRTLNMTYSNGDGQYKWKGLTGNGMEAIIFGDLPSGTNFSTEGPSEVEMILHDPYGDSSFATWETGKVTVETKDTVATATQDNSAMLNIHLGPDLTTNTGFGVSVQTEMDVIADLSAGFDRVTQNDTITSHITTIETSRAISTSAEPDFVGADADLYIGKSTNLLFGKARCVGLKENNQGVLEVMSSDVITMGKKFATNFVYTQYQIENVIVPNLKDIRNNLLVHVADTATATNGSSEPLYVTMLKVGDPDFGEPGTYKVLPSKTGAYLGLDMVGFYNDQIKGWYSAIEQNEKYKVGLFNNAGAEKINVSFGGGSETTETSTTSKTISQTISYTHSWTIVASADLGFTWNGLGADIETENNTTWEDSESETNEATTTATFSYTLADSGADDSFTMDVYPASGTHGPVFRTLGGQSSCPYEGQVLTKYYKPGKEELSAATWQIEDPELTCDNRLLTGVPTGGKAQFELKLKNNSVSKTDCYFNLVPVDGANPKGALLSLPTGPIGNGRTVFVPAGEAVTMILTLEQGNLATTKYDDIQLSLQSTCQDDICSTISLSAEFVPASTPVTMAIDKPVMNLGNKNDGLNIRVSGFDRYFAGLQRVDLQYMAPGDHSWSLLESYIPGDSVRTDNSQKLLPENGVIELPLDMTASKWIDGTYQFRARSSATFAGSPVVAESEVLTVVKDLQRPQLFGAANPNDGILNAGDEISLTFNEDIQKALLTDNNIVVSGVLNGNEVQHDVALSAQNTERAAYTEASYNLGQKDFSVDMWVRVTSAGDIFVHGTGDNKFKMSVDNKNHIVASIGDTTYVSNDVIDKDTWTFLTFTYKYNASNSRLSARAVTANGRKDLFANKKVNDYTGTGDITLGQNFSGAIHELVLWDKSRDMNEAQAEMYVTKKPSTPQLIGYWKMDEGSGSEIRDYARSRNMTMPNNTWYLNNDNKAVSLDGTKTVQLDISACSVAPTEDYAVEMWFKGAKADQKATSTLFSAASTSVSIGFNAAGILTMNAGESEIELSDKSYLDNAWHHLALNVLRNGNATVYVDGTPVKSLSATTVPTLEGACLYLGSKGGSNAFFKGTVDEVRLWNASMTGDLLTSQRTQRLKGDESGLVAYYSFEALTRDPDSGVISSVGSTKDLCTHTKEATLNKGNLVFVDEAPALKVKPDATNVQFSYVANERSIIITLNETPARLEGTTLQFTVRSVQDMNGNESSAVMWTAYVRQNNLLWKSDTDMSIEQKVGESTSFDIEFVNESGNSENWTLTNLPAWLTASATSGTLKAQLSKTITLTVDESIPVGKYEHTIYLTGNDNISEPLTISLKVKAEEPDWAVNPADYELSMNVIGQLQILGVQSQNEDDIVAAFIGNKCHGVAHPVYMPRYDGYFVTMDIYGNETDVTLPLEFKVFEAATGSIYPVVRVNSGTANSIKFNLNDFKGTYRNPVILNATDEIEQSFDLSKGWNWMSLGVRPDDNTVGSIFGNNNGKFSQVKSQTSGFSKYESIDEEWGGNLSAMSNTEMYMVQALEDVSNPVTGHIIDAKTTPITLHKGWNWVGFHRLQTMSLAEALADWNAQDEDIIKGQKGVAYYDGYEWVGSLRTLVPGQGYMIRNNHLTGSGTLTFNYPTSSMKGSGALHIRAHEPELTFSPVDYHSYPTNMVVCAQVVKDGQPVEGIEVGIFAGNECRQADVTDERGMVYVTVPGNESVKLNFRVTNGADIYESGESQTYEKDAILGTPKAPLVINLDEATGIWSISNSAGESMYDISGRKVADSRRENRQLPRGVYIVNGQKVVVK